MKIIDNNRLNLLSREASESPRLRKNLNLHADYSDSCQRLFNAMEPGTYIRPHRHSDPPKPECFMAIRGRMALIVFNGDGSIEQVIPFGEGCDVVAIDLPPAVWHSLVSLEPGSVFFETKPGPYAPLTDKDFAPWSPEEGSPDVSSY
ncbi:MAG: WbuC family cupin fold metalloprotein, partial [Gammaproteobacteria bacterium]|nr:WbuC family cupin fold metalloprotein [Gammaproteobacteria bacterium]NIW45468.1 cupin fold metalloprotein, WbuC family [Gammaproteobacteria bacterium]